MEIKESKSPQLETFDERREYLATQYDRVNSYSVSHDSYNVPLSRLPSFLTRLFYTYNNVSFSAFSINAKVPTYRVVVKYSDDLPF